MTEIFGSPRETLSDQLVTFLSQTGPNTELQRRWLEDESLGGSVYVRRTRRGLGDITDVTASLGLIDGQLVRPLVSTLDIADIAREDPGDVGPVANIIGTLYRIAPQHGVRALYADNLGDPPALEWMDRNGWQKTDFFYGSSRNNRYILLPRPERNVVLGILA